MKFPCAFTAAAQTDSQYKPDHHSFFIKQSADTSLPLEKLDQNFLINGVKDGVAVAARPAHWQQKDWLRFSALLAGTGTLLAFDEKLRHAALTHRSTFANGVAEFVEPVGSFYGIALFPVVYATGLAIRNPRVQSVGLRGSKAMAISTTMAFVTKNLIRRQRPDATDQPFQFALPFAKPKYTSLPSAHAAVAFTIATTLASEFPDQKWLPPVAYSLASLTALSRVYEKRHWSSDILLGAALGYFATKAVYKIGKKKRRLSAY
ncbi:phosphatase PAP2 family protein [Niabella insulamsoli]|uniref:phosphatase PAP2 family protein n=1 Tax=Niabella insulamsoli TaxID=3144874 RepID=UPI0031FC1ED8